MSIDHIGPLLRSLLLVLMLLGLTVRPVRQTTDYDRYLHQALTLRQAKQATLALQTLTKLDTLDLPAAVRGRMVFLRALLTLSQISPQAALPDLRYVVRFYPPLADYAGWHLLQHHASQDALDLLEATLTDLATRFPWSLHLPDGYLLLARTQTRLGQAARARGTLAHLLQTYRTAPNLPEALSLLARFYEDDGQLATAAQTWQQLGASYPTHALATEALRRSTELWTQLPLAQHPLPAAEPLLASLDTLIQARQWQAVEARFATLATLPLSPAQDIRLWLKRATVALRRQLFDQARTALSTLLERHPHGNHLAEALSLLARVEQRQGKAPASEQQYRRVITEYPQTSWAAEALWALGQMLEERKDFEGAADLYQRLAQQFPAHEKAEDALWQTGWRAYLLRRYEAAEALFQRLGALLPGTDLLPQALYWQARATQQLGRTEAAKPLFQRLLDEYPFHYYGLLAATAVGQAPAPPRSPPLLAVPVAIWNSPPPVALPADPTMPLQEPQFHLLRAQELQALWMYPEAARELQRLGTLLPDEPATHYFLGALYADNQDYLAAFRHCTNLMKALRPDEIRGLPQAFWTRYYPKIYWDEVAQHAQNAGLNPFLVLSMIRQESAFRPTAVSSSGAVGLMQLMPATARMMSDRLRLDGVTPDRLEIPTVNITLGTQYFAHLWQRYQGNAFLALAAYNAGPGRVDGWRKQWPQLPMDEFVEQIPFRETRFYVKLVLRNLRNYERLYATLSDG